MVSKAQFLYAFRAYFYAPITFLKRVVFGNDPHLKGHFWNLWGYVDPKVNQHVKDQKVLWINAASGGEVNQVVSFCKLLKNKYPNLKIFLSTESDDVFRFSSKLAEIDYTFYSPWDLGGCVRRVLNKIKPDVLLAVEFTRLPNLFKEAQRRGVKTILISALMNKAALTQDNLQRTLGLEYYRFFDVMGAKSEEDFQSFLKLGVDPKKISLTGNMKYDLNYSQLSESEILALKRRFKVTDEHRVFLAGSTYPGEERTTILAYMRARRVVPNLKFILVPRYVEFLLDAEKLASEKGIGWVKLSQLNPGEERSPDMILVDTFGELSRLYSIADYVFVGGSMRPVTNLGSGKNPIEPLSCGKPIMFGPFMNKWTQITSVLKDVWGNCEIKNHKDLAGGIIQLYGEPQLRHLIHKKTKEIAIFKQDPIKENFDLFVREALVL